MLLSDDDNDERFFGKGDVVRDRDSDDECIVIGSCREWLWLDPMDVATLCEPTALVQSKRARAGRRPSPGRIEAVGLAPGGRPQERAKRPRLAPVVSKTRSQKSVLTPKLALS